LVKKRLTQKDLIKEKISLLKEYGGDKEVIAMMEEKLKVSKRNKRSKDKGREYEAEIRDKFNSRFPIFKLRRTQQSGGAHKDLKHETLRGDICNFSETDFPFHLECKNQATWSLPSWIKQAEEECIPNKIPLIICKQQQKIKEGKVVQKKDDYVCLKLKDFLDIFEYYVDACGRSK
jgi:hypothetical protein